jgi:hypothetical protein
MLVLGIVVGLRVDIGAFTIVAIGFGVGVLTGVAIGFGVAVTTLTVTTVAFGVGVLTGVATGFGDGVTTLTTLLAGVTDAAETNDASHTNTNVTIKINVITLFIMGISSYQILFS